MFGGNVGPEVRDRDQAAGRGRVDDVAFALLDQLRSEGRDSVHDAHHVHVDHPAPVFEASLQDRSDRCDAGVVANHVDGAEARLGGPPERFDLLAPRDVGRDTIAGHFYRLSGAAGAK